MSPKKALAGEEKTGDGVQIIHLDTPEKATQTPEVPTTAPSISPTVESIVQAPADPPRPEADVVAEVESTVIIGSSKRIEKLPIKRKLIPEAPAATGETLPPGSDARIPEASTSEKPPTGEASLYDEVLAEKENEADSSSDYEFVDEHVEVFDKARDFSDKTRGQKIPPEDEGSSGRVPVESHETVRGQLLQPEGSGQKIEVPKQPADVIASRQDIDNCINAFLTLHLTDKWSVASYRKSVSSSIQRSRDNSEKIDKVQNIVTAQAEKMKALEALVESQAEMIKRLNHALDDSYKSYTELSERVNQQDTNILKVTDTSEWNNGEIFSLCSENVDDRNKQSLINTSLQTRLSVLEEVRKIDQIQAGTISRSEVNSLKMDGWQALAAFLAARGDFPRYLLDDENFTPLLRDKDEVMWLLAEYDTQAAARRFSQPRRYRGGNERGDASSSRPAQDPRSKDGPSGRQ